jgi:hypothetical protein
MIVQNQRTRVREALSVMEHLVSRLSYKPNTKLSVMECSGGSIVVRFFMCVPDITRRVSDGFGVNNMVAMEPEHILNQTEDHLIHVIQAMIVQTEMHEVDEWLRVEGVPVRDPHPDWLTSLQIKDFKRVV